MQQHGSKYFFFADPTPPAGGVKGQNSTFSEHGHVTYQSKWNHECSNMVANILPTYIYPPPHTAMGVGSIG